MRKNIVTIVPSDHKEGTKSVLTYKVLESNDQLSLLEVQLQTGRPHQIRVQLAGMGRQSGVTKNTVKNSAK